MSKQTQYPYNDVNPIEIKPHYVLCTSALMVIIILWGNDQKSEFSNAVGKKHNGVAFGRWQVFLPVKRDKSVAGCRQEGVCVAFKPPAAPPPLTDGCRYISPRAVGK